MAPQIIIVMGVTGVGKSTFIKYATGADVEIGTQMKSCTAEVNVYLIPGTEVYFVDTPGFDDPFVPDEVTLASITELLVVKFNDNVEIKGALYIHPVTEARMRGSGRKNLILFTKMLGDVGMSHCRLVTTKWSLQPSSVSEAREKELCEQEEFWEPLIANGAEAARFDDSMRSAIDIIKPLAHGSAFKPLLLAQVTEEHKLPTKPMPGFLSRTRLQ